MTKNTFLFHFFRFSVKHALQFYCRRFAIVGLENIPRGKPILLCPTHSNSFLDALFLCVYLDSPVYPLARGDAFNKPFIANILRQFKMLPIFRQTDGESDAFNKNEASFKQCHELFKFNQKVLIFPEGLCKHQLEVLPMKKGASVLAQRAWLAGLDLHVIPIGITYNNFSKWGKKCDLVIGKSITSAEFEQIDAVAFGKNFNEKLYSALIKLYPSPYQFKNNVIYRGLLNSMQYLMGWAFNAPIYAISYFAAKKLTKGTVFHDSAVVGMLSLLLPLYYLIIVFVLAICYC